MLTNDVRLLAMHPGKHSLDELNIVWRAILYEFASLIKTDKTDSIFELWKKIQYTECAQLVLDVSIEQLRLNYDPEIADAIVSLGFRYIADLDDRDEYLKQLDILENECKSLSVLMNQYLAEYKLLAPDSEDGKIKSLFQYEEELTVLSQFQGYRIDKMQHTCLQMCAIINSYNAQQKRLRYGIKK